MIFPVTFLFVVFVCAFPVAAVALGLFWVMRAMSRLVARFRPADERSFDWEEFEREFREYTDPGWAAARRAELRWYW